MQNKKLKKTKSKKKNRKIKIKSKEKKQKEKEIKWTNSLLFYQFIKIISQPGKKKAYK